MYARSYRQHPFSDYSNKGNGEQTLKTDRSNMESDSVFPCDVAKRLQPFLQPGNTVDGTMRNTDGLLGLKKSCGSLLNVPRSMVDFWLRVMRISMDGKESLDLSFSWHTNSLGWGATSNC